MTYTLNLDHPLALNPLAGNFRVSSLCPSPDCPISITSAGKILSRYIDDVWDLSPYALTITRLAFARRKKGTKAIDRANIDVHKRVMMWALYALARPIATTTANNLFTCFKRIIELCTDNGICASELHRFPGVYQTLGQHVAPSQWKFLRNLLNRLYRDRDLLGFTILDYEQISEVSRSIPRFSPNQTPFIPERIYFYVIERCSNVVEAYLAAQDQIEMLYRICVDATIRARIEFGHRTKYLRIGTTRRNGKKYAISPLEYYTGELFPDLASRYEVRGILLDVIAPETRPLNIKDIGHYLSAVALASRILIAAHSGMRDKEIAWLLTNCCETRDDPLLGTVHLLRGRTTKTRQDSSAYWVTSSVVGRAVSAAQSIAKLRLDAAVAKRGADIRQLDYSTAKLFERCTDPWASNLAFLDARMRDIEAAKNFGLGNHLKGPGLKLFDHLQVTITADDRAQALRLTPDLDSQKFAVGQVWPLAWHQFRRTLVCLALGAGVTPSAVAWQLKHAGTAMVQYYGNNYFDLPMERALRNEFKQTQIEMLLVQGMELSGENFIPTTARTKDIVIRIVNESDVVALEKAARNGKLVFRRTAIGICTNTSPCSYGGWDHIANCVECGNALASRNNLQGIRRMKKLLEADIAECGPNDALLRDSLLAQLNATLRVLNVLG